jgi:hypothetical protein
MGILNSLLKAVTTPAKPQAAPFVDSYCQLLVVPAIAFIQMRG